MVYMLQWCCIRRSGAILNALVLYLLRRNFLITLYFPWVKMDGA
jgi:hypothetical protein